MRPHLDPLTNPHPGDVVRFWDGRNWAVLEQKENSVCFLTTDGSSKSEECELPLDVWRGWLACMIDKAEVVNVAE